MRVYFTSESEKLQPYISEFEKASTGQAVKTSVIEAIKYANVLHSKRFGTKAVN